MFICKGVEEKPCAVRVSAACNRCSASSAQHFLLFSYRPGCHPTAYNSCMVPENSFGPAQQAQVPFMQPAVQAVTAASFQDSAQQPQEQQPFQHAPTRERTSDVKVHALEALNCAFFTHIYSSALCLLQQQYNFDAATKQFLDILENDDPFASSCSVAHQDGNSSKNRYRDVVPYDHNRVPLPPLSSSSSSSGSSGAAGFGAGGGTGSSHSSSSSSSKAAGTYINASFMTDPQLPGDASQVLGYIATQGPLPSTVADFWRMVAVTNTSAIVMLTGLTDGCISLGNSRSRCAPYFPDEEHDCLSLPGNITVTCVHKNNLDDNVFFRQLEVTWTAVPQQQQQQQLRQAGASAAAGAASTQPGQQPQRLWINHYQYAAWPDYGVPADSSSVRVLCHALDGCRRAGCKIVVHCSAGVGRTGTFIAIDMLLQRVHNLTLQPHGSVRDEDIRSAMDICSLVVGLRRQRRGTVQTAEQYAFVWQTLMDELQVLLQEQQEVEDMQRELGLHSGPQVGHV